MASQLQTGSAKGMTGALLRELNEGRTVDVAGYQLNPALAQGLSCASLQDPKAVVNGRLIWLEVASRTPPELLPVSSPTLELWKQAGYGIQAAAVNGPQFWQTVDIEEAPALITATVDALHAFLRVEPA